MSRPMQGSAENWHGSAGHEHPGFLHGRAVALQARAKPGEWVDLLSGRTSMAAGSKVWQIRHKPSLAFRPVGSFEARTDKRADGYAVQVRFIGEPPP